MQISANGRNAVQQPRIKSYPDFLRELGRSRVTGWRWARRGWLHPIRIAGKLFITDDEIQRFIERAERGELANVETQSHAATTQFPSAAPSPAQVIAAPEGAAPEARKNHHRST